MKLSVIKQNPANPRIIKDDKFQKLVTSIKEFPEMLEARPIVVNPDMIVLGGNMRLKAAKAAGLTEAPVYVATWEESKAKEFIVKDNVGFGEWDWDILANEWDAAELDEWGLDVWQPEDATNADEIDNLSKPKKLADTFLAPPFSVLDTRQGYWQKRKKEWNEIGFQSHLGRENNLLQYSETILNSSLKNTGTSIFDPVLCEIAYKWFNIPNGSILDPFAGGSVRGIVASKLGYPYVGVDLRPEQILENEKQFTQIKDASDVDPQWILGNSLNISNLVEGSFDFLFSCPPYFDLEKYSNDPLDLSNLSWDDFNDQYREIIVESLKHLKKNRFACFVIGDVRDKKTGFYKNFIRRTIEAFEDGGAFLYNEMILLEPAGSAAMRASRIFQGGRKVCKTHQNVLVFYKGDHKQITKNFTATPVMDVEKEAKLTQTI